MRRILLAGLVACLVPKLALASIIQYNDQASFAAAAPGATQYSVAGPDQDFGGSYTQGPATFKGVDIHRYANNGYGGPLYIAF